MDSLSGAQGRVGILVTPLRAAPRIAVSAACLEMLRQLRYGFGAGGGVLS